MVEFKESKFYKLLQDFFINNDKETFLQMLAEFYNRTEGIINKNEIQDDLIKELRELYLEFNENGIDENIVREKVNYFLENSVKIKDIIVKLITNANNIENINTQLEQKTDKATTQNIQNQVNNLVLGAVGDGNNAEVIQARGDYDVLNDRITFNEESINNRISINKQNKYDYDNEDIIWLEGYYISKDNKCIKYDIACVSEMLRVQPNTWYKRNKDSNNTFDNESRVMFYNEKGELLQSFGQKLYEFYFKTTEDTHYVRINIDKQSKDSEYLKRVIYNNDFNIFDKGTIGGLKSNWISGYYVNENNGQVIQHDSAKVSNFIKVYPNTKYLKGSKSSSSGYDTNVAFYDSNKIYISGVRLLRTEFEFKTPNSCAYIRIDGNMNVSVENEIVYELENCSFSIINYIEDRLKSLKNYDFKANSQQVLNLGTNLDSNYKIALTKGITGYDTVSIESPNIWWDSNKLKYGMVYTGYSDTDGYRHGTICLAWSDDLETWEKDKPILFPSGITGTPDYGSVTGPHIFFENGVYNLFYIGCEDRGYESGHKTICLATGTDIYNLTRYENNPVIRKVSGTWYGGDVYHPNVIKWTDGMYYLFFNARTEKSGWEEVIGYAISEDLKNWTVYKNISLQFQGENNGRLVVGDPWLYDIGDENIYMAYFSCNDSAWQTSTDNIAYTSKKEFPFNWRICKTNLTSQKRSKPCIVFRNGKHYHFYGNDSAEIGYYLGK